MITIFICNVYRGRELRIWALVGWRVIWETERNPQEPTVCDEPWESLARFVRKL